MKKIITIAIVLLSTVSFAQMKINDSINVLIAENFGVQVIGSYKLTKQKDNKKEYDIHVYYINNNNEAAVCKNTENDYYFAKTSLKGLSSYVFELSKNQIGKGVFLIEPKKQYEAKNYYSKWYNDNDIPEFTPIELNFKIIKNEMVLGQKYLISAGTLVKAVLVDAINGKDLSIGQKIDFILGEHIKIDDKIIIPLGSKIMGTVTDAKGSRMLGKKGKLAFTIDYLYYKDNVIKLQSQITKTMQGSGAVVAGASILLTPFALFINGKNAKYSKGDSFDCYVAENLEVK